MYYNYALKMAARHFKVQISIITNLQFFGKYLEQSISKMVGDTQRAVGSAYSVNPGQGTDYIFII